MFLPKANTRGRHELHVQFLPLSCTPNRHQSSNFYVPALNNFLVDRPREPQHCKRNMAAKVPIRSILKHVAPKPPSTITDEQKAKTQKDRKNLNLALQHAYLIQHQKDVSDKVLSSIETLLDYPPTTPPSAQDATRFLDLAKQFQPSDLDALVEERVIDGRCGYALCSKVPRSVAMGGSAAWKLGKGAADFCSAVCARKNAYIKTQLSEVPAWERDPSVAIRITLPEEDRPIATNGPTNTDSRAQTPPNDNADELALERGEKAASFRPKQVMTDHIVEKRTTSYKPVSSVQGAALSSSAIEGYEPKAKGRGKANRWGEVEDSDDDEGHGGDEDGV